MKITPVYCISGNLQLYTVKLLIRICIAIVIQGITELSIRHDETPENATLVVPIRYQLRLVSDYHGSGDCLQHIEFCIFQMRPEIRPEKSNGYLETHKESAQV